MDTNIIDNGTSYEINALQFYSNWLLQRVACKIELTFIDVLELIDKLSFVLNILQPQLQKNAWK